MSANNLSELKKKIKDVITDDDKKKLLNDAAFLAIRWDHDIRLWMLSLPKEMLKEFGQKTREQFDAKKAILNKQLGAETKKDAKEALTNLSEKLDAFSKQLDASLLLDEKKGANRLLDYIEALKDTNLLLGNPTEKRINHYEETAQLMIETGNEDVGLVMMGVALAVMGIAFLSLPLIPAASAPLFAIGATFIGGAAFFGYGGHKYEQGKCENAMPRAMRDLAEPYRKLVS